uniref:Uncharacterized protein n=1 Tax=Chlorocebus sabaeus TaxID=60711 RepID=A0A0D9RBP0_CHLSB
MYRRKSGWTGCAITCSPCTAMTQPRNCMRLSRSCSLTWETPRWYMAGRVATSTSGCRCWMSRRDLTPLPHPSEPAVLDCLGPCHQPASPGSPCWVLGLPFLPPPTLSICFPRPHHHLTAPRPSALCGYRAHCPPTGTHGRFSFWDGGGWETPLLSLALLGLAWA